MILYALINGRTVSYVFLFQSILTFIATVCDLDYTTLRLRVYPKSWSMSLQKTDDILVLI